MKKVLPLFLSLAAASACGGGQYRFADTPIVWRIADDQDIPEPAELDYLQIPYMTDVVAFRKITRALELRTETAAQNVNALDEVPDSTWFQNRIGVRSMAPSEVASGGAERGPPVPPLTIQKGKALGNNTGVWVEDSRGRKYLLKLDFPGHPELHTPRSSSPGSCGPPGTTCRTTPSSRSRRGTFTSRPARRRPTRSGTRCP
jgi:hypothetical protein